ncbi:hypothetical protein [Kiloniella sp.]|uniref:hypothetical protein n=1 Tax=Kiloniella sp. TaxID=1938587 RepID=UPI003B02B7E1
MKAIKHRLLLLLGLFLLTACQSTKPIKIEDPHGAFAVGDDFEAVRKDDFEKALNRNIRNPEKTILFIYNHGTTNSGIGQKCFPSSIPSYARAIVRQHSQAVIYYLCSQEIGVGSGGAPNQARYFRRSSEIGRILSIFREHGISANRTFLLGHSGGASTTLIAAADIPETFNGYVVSAPGYGFAYTGKSRTSKLYAPHYDAWKAGIEKASRKEGLVYAFEGDTYAPPEDLEFMRKMKNIDLYIQKPEECGTSEAHEYPWSRCFRKKETPKIWNYIQQRIKSGPQLISQNSE